MVTVLLERVGSSAACMPQFYEELDANYNQNHLLFDMRRVPAPMADLHLVSKICSQISAATAVASSFGPPALWALDLRSMFPDVVTSIRTISIHLTPGGVFSWMKVAE